MVPLSTPPRPARTQSALFNDVFIVRISTLPTGSALPPSSVAVAAHKTPAYYQVLATTFHNHKLLIGYLRPYIPTVLGALKLVLYAYFYPNVLLF